MKKWILVLVAVCVLMGAVTGGTITIAQKMEINRGEQVIKNISGRTEMTYLGLIDTVAVSRNSGYVYDGTAVVQELLRRAGLPADSDTWTSTVSSCHGVDIMKLTVYESEQEHIPSIQKRIKAEYLFGEF